MFYCKYIKRGLDILLSGAALIMLFPLFLFLALWIKSDSKGPVFFKQKRIGKGHKEFDILKFRTMRTDTPHDVPTHLLKNAESWITRSGRFLRKTSLDELPQLINIFKGDMSIVGPRPALWNQFDLIELRDAVGAYDIPQGLTGWAQVHGRDELELRKKAELDGYYARHIGFMMDLRCILYTVKSVLTGEGYSEGGPKKQ